MFFKNDIKKTTILTKDNNLDVAFLKLNKIIFAKIRMFILKRFVCHSSREIVTIK